MNDLCNLRCEYCFFDYYTKENPLVGRLSPQEIYEAVQKTGRNWHFFLGGGEPLLYPKFNELINLLQQDHGIQISTNLFNKNVKAFAEEVEPINIYVINASLHIDTKNESRLKKFIDNYHLLKNKGFEIMVSYVTYPPLFSRMKEDFHHLKEEGVEQVHPLTFQGEYLGKMYPESYTRDQIEMIRELTLEPMELLLTTNNMNFQNQSCKAGKHYFYMETDGEVYKCASVRDSCGNLFDGTFKPMEQNLICPKAKCMDSCLGITSLEKMPKLPSLKKQNFVQKGFEVFSKALWG
jgi:MoaA/NifB/PqqE/SkfB family radical SAM enzyme